MSSKKINHKVCKFCNHYMRIIEIKFDDGEVIKQQTGVNRVRAKITDEIIQGAKPHEIITDRLFCQIANIEQIDCPYRLEHIVIE